MTLQRAVRWLRLAVLALELVLRLLAGLPRLRKEAREAIQSAGAAYSSVLKALEDRELTREEVAQIREKAETLGREVADVGRVLAEVLSLEHALKDEGEKR